MKQSYRLIALLVGLLTLMACTPAEQRVLLEADGARRWVAVSDEQTVAELLDSAGVALAGQDRVEPASFTLLEADMLVRVVRVRERELSEEQLLPFDREVRRDASLPQGESRLLQLGQNGREQLFLLATLEDGVEVKREVVRRETLTAPTTEVLVVGTRGTGEPVPFAGTIVYLEQGNAWLMRGDSSQKRPLTRTGDLDAHVFSLSPDGRWLLFTRQPLGGASGQGGPLNTLWLVDTRITNEEPRSLDIDSILWADWQPCPADAPNCALQVAYSTAERVPTPPGWRAHNDLHRFGLNVDGVRGEAVLLLPASNPLFGWWGRSWEWSPDGSAISWGDATRIGLVQVPSGQERVLAQFLPFETRAPWVWTPQLHWTPDSRALLATAHRAGDPAAPDNPASERGERFDLLQIEVARGRVQPLLEGVGPFAMPRALDERRIVYGQAEDKTQSLTSRYTLMIREGEEAPRLLFPAPGQPGVDVPLTAWDPLDQAIVAVWQGDLYLLPVATSAAPRPLTAEGDASRPQWGP